MIKHISFDLWLTLIKSHPEFKQKRAELITETFNIKHIDSTEVEKFVRTTDKMFDRYNMINGKKLSANAMYYRILQKLVPDATHITIDDAILLRKRSDELFSEYPPLFINNNIPNILSQLKNEGYTINLSSNTGFIEGETLRRTLKEMNILHDFSFCIFSDEIEASKPSSVFFQKVYNNIKDIAKNQILHVGDNPTADYQGARSFGFEALLITNQNYSIDDIRARL